MHTFRNPKQYFTANMAHPSSEQPLFDWEDRLLGWQTIARGTLTLILCWSSPTNVVLQP